MLSEVEEGGGGGGGGLSECSRRPISIFLLLKKSNFGHEQTSC